MPVVILIVSSYRSISELHVVVRHRLSELRITACLDLCYVGL